MKIKYIFKLVKTNDKYYVLVNSLSIAVSKQGRDTILRNVVQNMTNQIWYVFPNVYSLSDEYWSYNGDVLEVSGRKYIKNEQDKI